MVCMCINGVCDCGLVASCTRRLLVVIRSDLTRQSARSLANGSSRCVPHCDPGDRADRADLVIIRHWPVAVSVLVGLGNRVHRGIWLLTQLHWNPSNAIECYPSLSRTISRYKKLFGIIPMDFGDSLPRPISIRSIQTSGTNRKVPLSQNHLVNLKSTWMPFNETHGIVSNTKKLLNKLLNKPIHSTLLL